MDQRVSEQQHRRDNGSAVGPVDTNPSNAFRGRLLSSSLIFSPANILHNIRRFGPFRVHSRQGECSNKSL